MSRASRDYADAPQGFPESFRCSPDAGHPFFRVDPRYAGSRRKCRRSPTTGSVLLLHLKFCSSERQTCREAGTQSYRSSGPHGPQESGAAGWINPVVSHDYAHPADLGWHAYSDLSLCPSGPGDRSLKEGVPIAPYGAGDIQDELDWFSRVAARDGVCLRTCPSSHCLRRILR